MSGMLFPDIGGALSAGSQAGAASAQNQFLQEDRRAKAEIAPLIPKALQGDKEALNQIGARHPDTFTKLMPMLQSIDANQRAKVKETSEWTTRAAMGVLSLPENERPAAYQAALADGQRLGYKIDMPPQYDRAVEGRLKHILNQARPIADYWKNQGENVQYTDAGGGGGAAPGGFTGQVAKDESGGNYNIPNAKGSGAYGKYQFMPDTWASVAQSNPQLNLPMNMRQATPQQQEAAMEAFTRMNGQQLAQSGVPATPANLYLAHRFGAAGATRFLSAPDNTPIAQVLPANWIQQNPDLNTTVGQFKRGVQSRYGGIPAGREVDVASNAAPMPEPPAGMAVPGTPAPMPQPPGLAQGDAAPRADASGNPLPPPQGQEIPREATRGVQLPPGYRIGTQGGKIFSPVPGYIQVMPPGGGAPVLWPVPKPKEPGADKGLFGDSLTGRALSALRTLTPDQQEYAAAYAILSKPQVVPDGAGGFTTIQPMNLSMFPKPTFAGGAFVEPPPAGGPAPTQVGGVTVQSIPGKGKPLDNSSRDDLTKASGGVLELTELVKSFDPSFGNFMVGSLGDADNFRKRNLPDMLGGKDEKGQAQWWQRYATFANLERNKLFGAALTPGEAAEFNKAMVNPGMKSDEITANLSRQRDVASKALSRIVNSMVASGYNPQAIEAATGIPVADLPSAMGGVPQAPRGATSPPLAPAPQQPAPSAPKAGDMVDGYVFRGGNPADKNNWGKVQ